MEILRSIAEFFDNKSVAAFSGAFAAFALVMLNDWRRDRRKVNNIRGEVEMNLLLAKGKLESIRSNRSLMLEKNRVVPAPILKFPTMLIRELSAEVLSRLTMDQRRSIEALLYTMEATDELLSEIYELARSLSGALGQAERMGQANRLRINFEDAIVNLKRLMEMCENYIAGRYSIIVTKQYDRLEYEEA